MPDKRVLPSRLEAARYCSAPRRVFAHYLNYPIGIVGCFPTAQTGNAPACFPNQLRARSSMGGGVYTAVCTRVCTVVTRSKHALTRSTCPRIGQGTAQAPAFRDFRTRPDDPALSPRRAPPLSGFEGSLPRKQLASWGVSPLHTPPVTPRNTP